MKSQVTTAVLYALFAASPAWTQWTGGPTGPINYSGGNVGIGTTGPIAPLTVAGTSYAQEGGLTNPAGISFGLQGSYPRISLDNGLGPANVGGDQWNIDNYFGSLRLFTAGSVKLQVLNNGNVGIGTTNPVHLLQVAGTIGAEEVIVSSTGADYVFRPDYPLKPLREVNAFIQEHHHLPEVHSAAEMKQKGVSLGEMQTKLLAKIEELTLHMIQAEERNNRLEHEVQTLRERLAQVAPEAPTK